MKIRIKGSIVWLVIAFILILTIFTLHTIQKLSKKDYTNNEIGNKTDLVILDFEKEAFVLYTDYLMAEIYIDNQKIDGDITKTSNGFEYYFNDILPENKEFDITVNFINDEDETTHIIKMNNFYHYTGNYLSDLTVLDNIEYLAITNKDVYGDIDSLSSLLKLKYLDIDGCSKIEGNIDALANLNLEYLMLKYCNNIVGNLSSLSGLENLLLLKLYSYHNIYGNLKAVSELNNLQFLDLFAGYDIEGNVDVLLELNKLEYLRLYATNLRGNAGTLASLKNLKYLELSTNRFIWGNIAEFSDLSELRELNITYSRKLYGNIKSLKVLEKLTVIDIRYCQWIGGALKLFTGDEVKVDYFDKANKMDPRDFQ